MSSSSDSVGTLLAAIANLVVDGLRILGLTDKQLWKQEEYEQLRALERVLDEAKKDFQFLAPLVNGQVYYENDRKHESIEELKALQAQFGVLIENLRNWSRSGGSVEPVWVRETHHLQQELHRAQCRAARRIFTSEKEASVRCLGAFLVHRQQRQWSNNPPVKDLEEYARWYRDELRTCNMVGRFQRFGEHDIAFICDYCDGHIVWEDLETMPSIRTAQEYAPSPISPVSPTTKDPHWQATGFTVTGHLEKQIIFSPVAIANHVAPQPRDWEASFLCPYCEEESHKPQEDYDEEELYEPENAYEDLSALQEHLEYYHTTAPPQAAPSATPTQNNCLVM